MSPADDVENEELGMLNLYMKLNFDILKMAKKGF